MPPSGPRTGRSSSPRMRVCAVSRIGWKRLRRHLSLPSPVTARRERGRGRGAVGGYPEWLDYCEDVIFDLKLREKYGPFVFVPEAVVHFRPRPNLRALFQQYHRYARGDGKANLFPRQHAIRYLTYLVVAPLLVYAAITVSPWLWLGGGCAGVGVVRLAV